MIGAIYGDIVGSMYEFDNIKTKEFEIFSPEMEFTDDSVMTVAVADALLRESPHDEDAFRRVLIERMHHFGNLYPKAGYGGHFLFWLIKRIHEPYGSYGNGSAMRVSPAGWCATSLKEAEKIGSLTASVTHDHPEGLKGAKVTAGAIYLAKSGASKKEIREYVEKYYDIDFTLADIRPFYSFDVTCQGTVPQAMVAFLESESFEDAIRNAISIGGDSDTLAAICGAVAEAYFGMSEEERMEAILRLDAPLAEVAERFYEKYVK